MKSPFAMVPIASVLIICANLLLIEAQENCDLGTLYYQELGCKPIYENCSQCPTSYDCPKYTRTADRCKFLGKSYKIEESITTTSGCNVACFCGETQLGLPGEIICAVVDCYWGPMDSTCYNYKNKIGDCCSGTRCEPYGKIAKCNVEGQSLKEGMQFFPKNTCYSCLCKKGYKGINIEPFCKKKQCDTEIQYSEQIENNCAPIYWYDQCCPGGFLCEKDAGKIKIVGGDSTKDKFCSFGETKVPVGGQFDAQASNYGTPYNVSCTCKVPPLPMCTKVD